MGWESSGVVGFGALSLRWIQFASVFRCARSSFLLAWVVKVSMKPSSRVFNLLISCI